MRGHVTLLYALAEEGANLSIVDRHGAIVFILSQHTKFRILTLSPKPQTPNPKPQTPNPKQVRLPFIMRLARVFMKPLKVTPTNPNPQPPTPNPQPPTPNPQPPTLHASALIQLGADVLVTDAGGNAALHVAVATGNMRVVHHTSHVTRHTSHVTRLTSHVTRHTSLVVSRVQQFTSHVI